LFAAAAPTPGPPTGLDCRLFLYELELLLMDECVESFFAPIALLEYIELNFPLLPIDLPDAGARSELPSY
jgi:hypothetical protein